MGLLRGGRGLLASALGRSIDSVHIQERLRKGLGTSSGDPVSALSDEVVPVIVVDDISRRELSSTRVRRYIAAVDSGAVTNESFIHLLNQDPKIKVIVEGIALNGSTTSKAIFFNKTVGVAGTGIVNQAYAMLAPGEGTPNIALAPGVCQFFREDVAVLLSTSGSIGLPLGSAGNAWFPLGITLGNNDRLAFSSATAATATALLFLITEVDPNP